jgi:DNA gyrase subunit A
MKFKKTKEAAAADAAAAAAAADDVAGDDEEDFFDAYEALPANVAGMAVVPAAVVQSLGLDQPSGAAAADAASASDASSEEDDAEEDADGGTGPWMLLLSSQGKGKRIALDDFKQQRRGGSGKKGLGLFKGDRLAALCLTGMGASGETAENENVIIGSQGGVMNRFDVNSIRWGGAR